MVVGGRPARVVVAACRSRWRMLDMARCDQPGWLRSVHLPGRQPSGASLGVRRGGRPDSEGHVMYVLPRCGTRLDWKTVHEIRSRHIDGESTRALAGTYHVSQKTIWKITSGRAWKVATQA